MTNYTIKLHRDAEEALGDIPGNDRDRLTSVITEVSEHRKLTEHSKCKVLNNNHSETLNKIRVGSYRILAELDKPDLKILKIGERQGFYSDIDGIYAGM